LHIGRLISRDVRFATRDARVANMDAINGYIEAFTRSKRTAELVPLFAGHGVPAAEVRSPAAAVRDARVSSAGNRAARASHAKRYVDLTARATDPAPRGCRAAPPAPAVARQRAGTAIFHSATR
jgi:crotonobetainyl-CoA:carnitine CoA-transferase CaiB-like acyl-CoA transferase